MKSYSPYCYLYKDFPNEGDLYVSTVVYLPSGIDLDRPSKQAAEGITIFTYPVKASNLPAGIRIPSDEKIVWDGSERIVKVVVNNAEAIQTTTVNSKDLE